MRGVDIEERTRTKQRALHELLRSFGSVCIGYSGGVDSVYLARAAVDALGRDRVLAVTGISAAYPAVQRDVARACAKHIGLRHVEIDTYELSDPNYAANPSNRCYYCKIELWRRLRAVADAQDIAVLADGANADDAHDYRPGSAAGRERRVRSPLLEVGLTKSEIRLLSRERGLPTWDLPAAPCLSSRIPYGLAVTPRRLGQVEAAEAALRAAGFDELRVRHHGDAARIEVAPAERARVLELGRTLDRELRAVGFASVLLDVEGYRRGGLNEGLHKLRSQAPPSQPPAAGGRSLSQADARVNGVAALLEAEGIDANGVHAAGHQREIAVMAAPPSSAPRLAALAPAIRVLGFRYVTIDLAGATGGGTRGTDRMEIATDGKEVAKDGDG